MRFTTLLCQQHIGRMQNKHWYWQGKRVIYKTVSEEVLTKHGIQVVDGVQTTYHKHVEPATINIIGMYDKPKVLDEKHPDWKSNPCFIYKDEDVLLEGVQQAQALTNTVEISQSLPSVLTELEASLNVSDEVHNAVKNSTILSCLFEATQVKLPKRKDRERPAWIFPRDFGIPDYRMNELLSKNLVTACELYQRASNRKLLLDACFSVPLQAHGKQLQYELTSELLITSSQSLPAVASPSDTESVQLPDLAPVHCTISINPYSFYELKDTYPVSLKSKWPHVHTAIVHHNKTQVKNLYGSEVAPDQIVARSLLKGFCFAAAEARARFGEDVDVLPESVTVQVVQTDGRMFHFTVFQLNTLSMDSSVKNMFWHSPAMSLYDSCKYENGRPTFENYNPLVFNRLLAFYKNG